jgi:hypothetical protein
MQATPDVENPGRFCGLRHGAGASPIDKSQRRRRKTVSQENEAVAQFHDSDSEEDVYDLFNACNGILVDGFLDVNQLDELSPEEQAALNVPRLREIWAHTKTGCAHCATIVTTLNQIRGTLRARAADWAEGRSALVDVNIKDPIG